MLFDFLSECGQWDDDWGVGSVTEILGLRFECTCGACPEQYDVFDGDEQVGYVRLRHGGLSVECPDSGGEYVFYGSPAGDGIFHSDERGWYLAASALMIRRWMIRRDGGPRLNFSVS